MTNTASAKESQQTIDERFMRRALQLAARGSQDASPNPMVGAVIVCDGRIIGEGFHRKCGEAHAEVNAVASVSDTSLLTRSTIYVTLEPCAHYGKTPPCAKLLIDKQIPRIVIGTVDPFSKVDSKGIRMLRDSGAEVVVGVLQQECRQLNRKFFTAHTLHRPYITLKWAMSADGFMDSDRLLGSPAPRFSTPLTSVLVHQLRSRHDAILTSAKTLLADNARLDTRLYAGRSPLRVVVDRSGRLQAASKTNPDLLTDNTLVSADDLPTLLRQLYDRNVTSVLVEAGPTLLKAFLDAGLWDEVRREVAPFSLGSHGRSAAPILPSL